MNRASVLLFLLCSVYSSTAFLASSGVSFHKDKMSWSNAQKVCKELGGSLVRIASESQNTYLLDELKTRKIGNSWIGLTDQEEEGKFVWTGPMYNKFGPGEPNDLGGEDCAEIIPGESYGKNWNGDWNDNKCSKKKSFICQKSSEYTFHKESMEWAEAEKHCQKSGGNLARIATQSQNDYIVNELKTRKIGNSWIGLTDQEEEGKFIWTGPMYNKFGSGEPNDLGGEDCAEIIPGESWGKNWNGNWNDSKCSKEKSFICEKN